MDKRITEENRRSLTKLLSLRERERGRDGREEVRRGRKEDLTMNNNNKKNVRWYVWGIQDPGGNCS